MEKKLSLGAFDLIRPIGKGSMGVVWEALHRTQGIPVAIKVITELGVDDESFRLAFANEVRAVVRLHHPSIIHLLDYGITDEDLSHASGGEILKGSQYYAMELATGGTLPRPKTPIPWSQMRFLLLELLDVLAHAHARDVIHRDIKPSNILLMRHGDRTQVKLTDFGIAKAFGSTDLPSGVVAGTPRYMAPEQILNQIRDQGPWTDLYSLGCLAYQFATGRRIFAHASGTEVLRCQIKEDPEPVKGSHLPKGFDVWLSKMLAKRVEDRFEYAAEAAWALICLPEPASHHPISSELMAISPMGDTSDSYEYSIVNDTGDSSSVFRSLYVKEVGVSSVHEVHDISEQLLNDMGDTLRMDSADIAMAIAQQTSLAQVRDGVHLMSTLAEMVRHRPLTLPTSSDLPALMPIPATWRRDYIERQSMQLLGAGLGLWGMRSIPMVNRDEERDLVYHKIVSTVRTSVPECLLIDGPRGSGKSRLVEWMLQRTHELALANTLKAFHYAEHHSTSGIVRAMMYHIQCQNLTQHEALSRARAFLSRYPLEEDFDDAPALVELMQLANDPEKPVAGIHFNSIEEKYVVLLRFLLRLCEKRPTVLWLDDVHYSSFSLDFIDFVFSSPFASSMPLMIVGTTRIEDLDENSGAYKSLCQLRQRDRVTVLPLTPLDAEAHLELVHELIGLDDELCKKLAMRTSGMPLFAIQLVGDWVERGVLVPGQGGFTVKEGASDDLPDSLHELWLSRLRLIFKDSNRQTAWEQLEIAACLGTQFDADEWRIACEMSGLGSMLKTLERMLEHHLFEINYPVVRFSHHLLHESLLRYTQENGRIKQHHLCCADMLKAYFSDASVFYDERRAKHLFKAQAYESSIEPYLQAAIVRRQRSEFGLATELFRRREEALDACQAAQNSPIRALGWVAEANGLLQQVKLDEAELLIERSIELGTSTQSPVVQALAYREKGLLLQMRNNLSEAIDALMASLSFFNQISERRRAAYVNDRAEALWLIGRVCDMRHELDLARSYLQQGIDIQSQSKDAYGLARSYKTLGNTYQHGGMYEEARFNIEFALGIFQQEGYRLNVGHCYNDIGEIYRLGYNQPEQAEVYYRNAMDIYRELNPLEGSTTTINLVLLLISKKRYTEAKTLIHKQIETMERAGQSFDLNWLYATLLPCCAATFDWPGFDDAVLRLGKSLEDSMVVDADILYCTELAAKLCDRYASKEQGRFCREIAMQQAIRLNDQDAIERLTKA